MKSNSALRTLVILIAWLVLQNFNVLPDSGPDAYFCKSTENRTGKLPETACALQASANIYNGKSNDSFEPSACSFDADQNFEPFPPILAVFHKYKIRKVVLDAGHGGKDPGCIGAISKEKDNTLAIILNLGALIKEHYPQVDVIYTRASDEFIELNERAAIANRNSADLFISVHCNSIPAPRVSGTETYVLGVDRAQHNLEVAKRENAVISLEADYKKNYDGYDPESPEAHILSSVWQSAYLEQSILFAGFVQEQAHSIAEREDKGVKQAGFLVLRETAMPAVLIESGYLTNRQEEAYIASEEGQQQMAESIFRAFEAYKDKLEGNANPNPAVIAKKEHIGAVPKSEVKPLPQKHGIPQAKTVSVKETAPGAVQKNAKPVNSGYQIQLMSWTSRLDPATGNLSLIGDVREEKVGGKYYYYTGAFKSRTEAEKMLMEIKNLGFKTAIIVPVGK
ncbi:MAG: N-acetylmuramoyl-L-alanine amidase [Bacteroidota bacterium]